MEQHKDIRDRAEESHKVHVFTKLHEQEQDTAELENPIQTTFTNKKDVYN